MLIWESPYCKANLTLFMQEDYTTKSKQIQEIANIFEGSVVGVEPLIPEERIKDFQSAYAYIMQTYKPNHNIKPCVAYVLLNGIPDGWRTNAYLVVFECLRVYDGDVEKASELIKLYLDSSQKKKTRTWKHLEGAIKWVQKTKPKISCQKFSYSLGCVGSKDVCNTIRGIKHSESSNKYKNLGFAKNQITSLWDRLLDLDNGYLKKMSIRSVVLYAYILNRYWTSGFDTLYISYKEFAKALGDKKVGSHNILPYLRELQKLGFIAFKSGSAKGIIKKPNGKKARIATEIKVLDITKRAKNRANELFEELFK